MRNIKLTLLYDGNNLMGWQKTPTGPSVEEILQNQLQTVLRENIILQAASRTDSGVHASEQVVNFFTTSPIDLGNLSHRLNSLMPRSIRVSSAKEMPAHFHPTLDSMGKEYHYFICFGKVQLPQHRFYSWHCPYEIDLKEMEKAATFFLGKNDFAAFCNVKKNETYQDYVRDVKRIAICELPHMRLRIEIEGNHFLYKMVRNIVGTLVDVAKGKLKADDIPDILQNGDRTKAGVTAPAHGLILHRVHFG